MSRIWIRGTLWVLALTWVVPGVDGYFDYVARIPNGDGVGHPCNGNVMWKGVGHFNVQGGGARNQFGLDFAATGRTWTNELCRKDSDGDGRTNGEELGDPECIWTPGQTPQSTAGITHPGVCDPFGSDACSNRALPRSMEVSYETVGDWMKEACDKAEFGCPGKDGDDIKELDFRMPVTPVPAKETTYMCMMFEWPDVTRDFHVIATEPVLNNSYVMHHILLFGCSDDTPMKHSPWECGMAECTELVSSWGFGATGHCLHRDTGVLMGKSGFKKFLLQYHWNNPKLHGGMSDSSGMKLYYTPRLRPYNTAMLVTGQVFIHIPPRAPHVVVGSDCTPACTRNLLTGDIKITSAVNHMHALGHSMNIELHRCGRFLVNLTNELDYNYDTPRLQEYPDVVTLQPGDMIRTTCRYSSLNKASSTFFGAGTSDEMCFGFISFYPKENMPTSQFCVSWKGFSKCDPHSDGRCSDEKRAMFSSPTFNETQLFHNVTTFCHSGLCTEECKTALRIARKCDPCLSNEVSRDLIRAHHLPRSEHGWRFAACLSVCETELDKERQTQPRLSDTIVCPEDGTPDPKRTTTTSTATPAYSDSCSAELSLSSANPAPLVMSSLGLSVGLALGTLYQMGWGC